jgi:putative Mg2+ transporter-C (MgtC) family protein
MPKPPPACASNWSNGWRAAQYPVAEVEAIERGDLQELVATLVSTAVQAKELDMVAADLQRIQGVRHATWESSTKD